MRLSDLLTPDHIRIPLRAAAKEDVLRELVGLLPSASENSAREQILEAVLEREERMSTGIGQGVAIPHGKSDQVESMEMAFGLAAEPVDFQALDGEACRVFFLLVSPPGMTGPHIRALAQVSRVLISHSVREELAGAANAEEVRALLRREESLEEDDD
jgi:mannitol/fructose-specific phosphotransferase system IIA component (Ntr-type)